MPRTLAPRFTLQSATCEYCNGTGRRPIEWDILTGAVVALGPCGSCMTRGVILTNVMESQEEPLCGKP